MKRSLAVGFWTGFVLLSANAQGQAYRGFRTYHLTCESENHRYKICEFRKEVAGAKIYERTSGSECDLGENWGYSSRYLWVSDGCAANFMVFEDVAEDGYEHVLCGSVNYQVGKCFIADAMKPYSLQLVVQLSRSTCKQDLTWGQDSDSWTGRDYVWTSDGCEGLFVYNKASESNEVEIPPVDFDPGFGGSDEGPNDDAIIIDLGK